MRSLDARLNRIAESYPEPAPEPERDDRWFDEAPPAVMRYYLHMAGDFANDPLYEADRHAAYAAHRRRYPAFPDIAQAVFEALVYDFDILSCAQAALLRGAYHKLSWAISRERAGPGHGGISESQDWAETARRMTGDDYATYNQYWDDRAGTAWPQAWRDRGTRDPKTLEAMQFGDAELELLAAVDDPPRDERTDHDDH